MAKKAGKPQQAAARGQAKMAQQRAAYMQALERSKPFTMPQTDKKLVVSLGWASAEEGRAARYFPPAQWHEIRVDVEERVKPDIHSRLSKIEALETGSVDAVCISHVLQRFTIHEAEAIVREALRIMKDGGDIVLSVPDMQLAAAYLAHSEFAAQVYHSPAGPITPIDLMFGFQKAIRAGDFTRLHRCGFTAEMFGSFLRDIGVCNLRVVRQQYDIAAQGKKLPYGHPDRVERIVMQVEHHQRPSAAAPEAVAKAAAPVTYADKLEDEPQMWKPLGLAGAKASKASTKK